MFRVLVVLSVWVKLGKKGDGGFVCHNICMLFVWIRFNFIISMDGVTLSFFFSCVMLCFLVL